MNEWLGDLPIWLVAENGLYYRRPAAGQHHEWEITKEEVPLPPQTNHHLKSISSSRNSSHIQSDLYMYATPCPKPAREASPQKPCP